MQLGRDLWKASAWKAAKKKSAALPLVVQEPMAVPRVAVRTICTKSFPPVCVTQYSDGSASKKIMSSIKTPEPVTIAPPVAAPILKEPVFVPTMTRRAPPVPVKPGAFTAIKTVVKTVEREPAALPMPDQIEPEKKPNYLPLILGAGAAAFLMLKQ